MIYLWNKKKKKENCLTLSTPHLGHVNAKVPLRYNYWHTSSPVLCRQASSWYITWCSHRMSWFLFYEKLKGWYKEAAGMRLICHRVMDLVKGMQHLLLAPMHPFSTDYYLTPLPATEHTLLDADLCRQVWRNSISRNESFGWHKGCWEVIHLMRMLKFSKLLNGHIHISTL